MLEFVSDFVLRYSDFEIPYSHFPPNTSSPFPMSSLQRLADVLPETASLMAEGVGRLHPGMQIYVARAGEVVIDDAIGLAHNDEPLTSDHRMPWLSAGKPLIAVALLQQVEAGRVALDAPVATCIPEFAANGKAAVTVRQLLTHTSAIQPVPTGWPRNSWDAILDRICSAKLRHGAAAGQVAAYDPARSWFLLGEILQRVTGQPLEQILDHDLCTPLGLTLSDWSIPAGDTRPTARMHQCDGATCHEQSDARLEQAPPAPGASYRGPARELGRFYEMLLAGGSSGEHRFLAPETVSAMTSRQRVEAFDLTFQHVVDFGLGVLINSNRYGAETVPYGFGRYASPETFGHGGSECSIAFADPRAELVVAIAANGRPGEAAHQRRNREICSALYTDLGLA